MKRLHLDHNILIGKQDLEYISGVYSSMQGDTGAQHETYRGMLAVDEHSTRRIKAWMQSTVEPSLEHVGKVFKEIAQQTYKANKVFRIVQPDSNESKKIQRKQEQDVVCKYLNQKRIFISHTGIILPCCFFNSEFLQDYAGVKTD